MKNTKVENDLIELASNLWEIGSEMSQQLRSELNHTYWNLSGRYGIADQCRELNQISIELVVIESQLNEIQSKSNNDDIWF